MGYGRDRTEDTHRFPIRSSVMPKGPRKCLARYRHLFSVFLASQVAAQREKSERGELRRYPGIDSAWGGAGSRHQSKGALGVICLALKDIRQCPRHVQ